ncbi:hypothetical protein BDV12DRAFT_71872 [Aspergillus spectabilis]
MTAAIHQRLMPPEFIIKSRKRIERCRRQGFGPSRSLPKPLPSVLWRYVRPLFVLAGCPVVGSECGLQAAAYGKCIVADYQGVHKDMCAKEFMKLKDCFLVRDSDLVHFRVYLIGGFNRRHPRMVEWLGNSKWLVRETSCILWRKWTLLLLLEVYFST